MLNGCVAFCGFMLAGIYPNSLLVLAAIAIQIAVLFLVTKFKARE